MAGCYNTMQVPDPNPIPVFGDITLACVNHHIPAALRDVLEPLYWFAMLV